MAVSGTVQVSLNLSDSVAATAYADKLTRNLLLGQSGIAVQDIALGAALGIKSPWSYHNPAFTGQMTFDLTALPLPQPGAYSSGSPIATFALVKLVYVLWLGTDGQILYVGNAATNAWSQWGDTAAARVKAMPSSPLCLSNLLAQGSNPWTVDGTHKNLMIDAGANTAEVSVCILGA